MTVIEIADDAHFQRELAEAGVKLVVVDFFATWCGPCRRIAPVFQQYATKYHNAVFLKVDVDKCKDTAASHSVTAMPTFILLKNAVRVDMLRGADHLALEEKIKKHYTEEEANGDPLVAAAVTVKGHMDLSSMIYRAGCECLNSSDDHTLDHALSSKGGYLESDCDEQLIISLSFSQAVKLHSLRLNAPTENGPKNIKLFINMPQTLDFDRAESMTPVQAIELKAEDLDESALIPLKFVKYQNVQSLTIFVADNQSGSEVTQIDYIGVIGSPISVTNMSDFKRVAGKKGESE